ncbi:MAG: MOSC domain-containing protein [Bosea sp.]|nr:MOSC domain-containing protein [Bosea sp. (in: a-proteobacteria)]MCP4738090.1 MOSC domain-containing protein [Bosea sp. (in: a-proteobacteria)]
MQPQPGSLLSELLNAPIRPGRVDWIGLRPARRAAMTSVETATASAAEGLVGDRYSGRSGSRQVTLIQREHLAAIASHLGLDRVAAEQLRRNIVVEGVNLAALKDHRFRLGTAILAYTGECHPCSRMEEAFGPGGYNAVRGHGGITARVVESGTIAIGDRLERLPATSL